MCETNRSRIHAPAPIVSCARRLSCILSVVHIVGPMVAVADTIEASVDKRTTR